jgi:hypothetical protein
MEMKSFNRNIIFIIAALSLIVLSSAAWSAVSLPTANVGGTVQTTATDLTFNVVITRANYLPDGTEFAVANDGVTETIINAEMALIGASRTGPLSFADATLEIRDPNNPAYKYMTATLSNITFDEVYPGVYYLNLALDASNPSSLNLSNVVLYPDDGNHPSRFISELGSELGTNDTLGLKLGFYVNGDVTATGTGTVFDGLLDGVVASVNSSPVAVAGVSFNQSQCLSTSCDVALDGSESTDPDSTAGTNDDIVSFEWFEDANNDGIYTVDELIASGATVTVGLPLGFHEITLLVTDTQGATDVDVITVVVDAAQLSFIEIDKAHVKRNGKLKIRGRLALPAGVTHAAVNSVGRAIIGISSLGTVIDETVDFTESSNGNKWKYKASPALGLKKFMIDWDGAKFNYQNGFLTIKSDHIGDDETSIEINSCSPVNVEINGVTVSIDANDVVTVNDATTKVDGDDDGDSDVEDSDHGNSADDDDGDCAVQVNLPFALTPDMVMTITGSVTDSITIGDYMTAAVGKFKIDGRFDPGTVDFSTLTPSLDLTVTLGDQGFNATLVIDETSWTKVKPKYWMFRLKK